MSFDLGGIAKLAGQVLGGILGGPAGATIGSMIGSWVGGAISGDSSAGGDFLSNLSTQYLDGFLKGAGG